MNWLEVDKEMQAETYHLRLHRTYEEWFAVYLSPVHLGASGQGKTVDEAVLNAAKACGWKELK